MEKSDRELSSIIVRFNWVVLPRIKNFYRLKVEQLRSLQGKWVKVDQTSRTRFYRVSHALFEMCHFYATTSTVTTRRSNMERNWKLPSSRRVSDGWQPETKLGEWKGISWIEKKLGKPHCKIFDSVLLKCFVFCSVLHKNEMCIGLWFQSRFQNCSREIFFSLFDFIVRL